MKNKQDTKATPKKKIVISANDTAKLKKKIATGITAGRHLPTPND
jgi:hypothetical protein